MPAGGTGGYGSGRRRRRLRAVGRPAPVEGLPKGVTGWRQSIPGRREVVTPCVHGGRVFVGGGFGSHEFYAFEADTGELVWGIHTGDDGPTAAVAADDCVAFNTESCTVLVVDARHGGTLWERWLGDPLLAQPAIGGGLVYMAWPHQGDHRLGAFHLRTGEPVWSASLPGDVITAPVYADGCVYVSAFDGSVQCFAAETGRLLFTRELSATSAPWVHAGEVYVARREGGPEAAAPGETLWRARGRRPGKFGPTKSADYLRRRRGTRRHHEDAQMDASVGFGQAPASAKLAQAEALLGAATVSRAWRWQGSRPCVAEGRVFSVVGDELTANSLETGDELWKWKAPLEDADERVLTPPAVTNDRVYVGGRDGRLRCFDAATGAPRFDFRVGLPLAWQPVVSGGWVYCGAVGGNLVGLCTGDPQDDGWPMWGGGPGHNGAA